MKSSWQPGWFTSARRVTVRDQLPRGGTLHTWDDALVAHPGNQGAGTGEVIRRTAHLGECARQAPGHLSCSDLWMAQNTDPTESVPLWSTQEPEPAQLRPGKSMQPRAHFRQFPWRASWSLSSVDLESTCAVSGGKPSVAQTLWALPHMPVIFFCSVPPSPLEKEMATHSSILAWRIPWTEEPGGLQFTGSQRVGHDWATLLTSPKGR